MSDAAPSPGAPAPGPPSSGNSGTGNSGSGHPGTGHPGTGAPTADLPSSFLEAATLDCIHCGLCLRTCPTYQLTGSESSSPRGRIHLMRSAAEGRLERDDDFTAEMDFCLLCRHCESACPAGVGFGAMMEHTRGELEQQRERPFWQRLARRAGFAWLLPHRAALRLAGLALWFGQTLRLDRLAAAVVPPLARSIREAPRFPNPGEQRPLPRRSPANARGDDRSEVLVLEGCVMPLLFGRVNRDTVASLNALGHDVVVPDGLTCCGSLQAHNGDLPTARRLAKAAILALEQHPDAPLVVNSAGCGSHLRELGGLFSEEPAWRARAERVSARVRDFSEVVAPLLESDRGTTRTERVAWDAPCHLCHGQQIRDEPLSILDALPGVERVTMADSEGCCGSAGIYALQRPDDAAEILAPKLDALERTGAETLVTANPGCQLQWQQGVERRGLSVRVRHLAELVAERLGRG